MKELVNVTAQAFDERVSDVIGWAGLRINCS
jgi:hypothetical protein